MLALGMDPQALKTTNVHGTISKLKSEGLSYDRVMDCEAMKKAEKKVNVLCIHESTFSMCMYIWMYVCM